MTSSVSAAHSNLTRLFSPCLRIRSCTQDPQASHPGHGRGQSLRSRPRVKGRRGRVGYLFVDVWMRLGAREKEKERQERGLYLKFTFPVRPMSIHPSSSYSWPISAFRYLVPTPVSIPFDNMHGVRADYDWDLRFVVNGTRHLGERLL